MLQFLKTIDVAVRDEDSLKYAVDTWETLLGATAIEMKPEYSPPGGVAAFHIPMPTGEFACHAIGIFRPTDVNEDNPVGGKLLSDFMDKHGESTFLLSFMVDDMVKTQEELTAKGFEFFYDEPVRYAAGVHNFVKGNEGLQDIVIHVCKHDEGGLERWRDGQEEASPYAGEEMGKPTSDYWRGECVESSGQCTVNFSGDISAGMDAVWRLLGNFGDLSWIPGSLQVESVGHGVGMSRHITLPDQSVVREELCSRDENKHCYSYRVGGHLPYPISDYSAEVKLDSVDDACTRVSWTGTFYPRGVAAPEAETLMLEVYQQILHWLQLALE